MFANASRFLRPVQKPFIFILGATLTSISSMGLAATVTNKPSFPSLEYWDNWTDAQGVSHLTKCRITSFNPVDEKHPTSLKAVSPKEANADKKSTSPLAMVWTGANRTGSATVTTTVQPPGWKSPWHATKHVEWIVPVAGIYTTQTMDGTRIELNPGDILLNEDGGSIRDSEGHQGHLSTNEGKEASALMVTQFNAPANHTHKACVQK